MTIPMVVMVIGGLLWFLWDVVTPDNPGPIPLSSLVCTGAPHPLRRLCLLGGGWDG
jgi:hypothetical protein